MNQSQTESQISVSNDTVEIEDAFRAIWQKARSVSEVITQLRQTKRSLEARIAELEQEEQSLRSDMLAKEQEFKRLRAEYLQLLNAQGNNVFSLEEKENLKNKIRDLIAKINSHL